MAERYAVASGNWSDVATWDGGTTLPGASDDVHANGFTVTINQNVTVLSIRNDAGATAAAGGGFTVSGDYTVTADVVGGHADTVIEYTGSGSAAITGDQSAASGSGVAIRHSGSGLLTVTGTRAAMNYKVGIQVTSSGDLVVVGDWPANSASTYLYGIHFTNTASGTLTVTGDLTASNGYDTHAVYLQGTSYNNLTVVVNGDCYGGTGSFNTNAIFNRNSGTGTTVVINGHCVGGDGTGVPAAYYQDTTQPLLTVNGDISAGSAKPGLVSVGTVIHNGNQTANASGVPAVDVGTGKYLIHASDAITHTYRVNNAGSPGVARSLYTGGTDIGNPAEADVRSGTTYGPASEYTGSLAVPDAQYVSQGVSVDATVGTLTGAGTLAAGTAQGGASTTIQLAASETFGDDILNGNIVKITDGTGAGQSRRITDYVGATNTATVHEAWTTTPDNTSVYEVVEGSHVTGISQDEVNQACDDAISDAALATDESVAAIGAAVGALNDLSAADVNAACDTAIADAGLATADNLATVDNVVDNIQLWTHRIATKEFGVISNAGTSAESFTLAELGITVTYAGLDSSGNRTGVTFS